MYVYKKSNTICACLLDLFADVTGGTVGKLRSYVLAYAAMPDIESISAPNMPEHVACRWRARHRNLRVSGFCFQFDRCMHRCSIFATIRHNGHNPLAEEQIKSKQLASRERARRHRQSTHSTDQEIKSKQNVEY